MSENPTGSAASAAAGLGTLLRLAWPIVLARATQAVIGFTDALFVAPLGEAPLAATTTGALNTYSAIMLPMGTVFIVQSFVAQLRGRNELERVPRYAYYGLAIAAGGALLAGVAIPFVPFILSLFHYAPAVHADMSTYLSIRLLSVGAALGTEALGNWFGGLGKTQPAMVAGIVAMVVNVAACFLLVQPRLGLPGFGVVGAAWASVLGTWLGFGVVTVAFLREAGAKLPAGMTVAELGRVLRFGLPNGANWFLEFAAFALFINGVVGSLGTTPLAALNVVMQLNSIAFMPALGIASGGAILVGEAIGRKAVDEVGRIVRLTCIVAMVWMGSVGLLYTTAPRALIGLFGGGDPIATASLVETGATMLMFSALWQLFDAVSMTLGESLRAAGDTTWCMGARIVLAWVVFTPLAWTAVFVFHGGVNTVMTSLVGYLAVLAVTLSLRFFSGKWREIEMVGEEQLVP